MLPSPSSHVTHGGSTSTGTSTGTSTDKSTIGLSHVDSPVCVWYQYVAPDEGSEYSSHPPPPAPRGFSQEESPVAVWCQYGRPELASKHSTHPSPPPPPPPPPLPPSPPFPLGSYHDLSPRVPKFRYLSESKRNFSEISEKLNSEPKFRYLTVDKFK